MNRFPLTHVELLDIQTRRKGDPDVRALLWEIKRQNDIIEGAESLRQSIDRAWKAETHSHLAGLHSLRALLQPELNRFPKKR